MSDRGSSSCSTAWWPSSDCPPRFASLVLDSLVADSLVLDSVVRPRFASSSSDSVTSNQISVAVAVLIRYENCCAAVLLRAILMWREALQESDRQEPSGPNRTRARQSDRDPGPGPWSRRCAICLHSQADHDCVQCAQAICRACGKLGCHEYNSKPHVLTPRQMIWSRSDASSAANAQEAHSAYE